MRWYGFDVVPYEKDDPGFRVLVRSDSSGQAADYLYETFLSCNDKIHPIYGKIVIIPEKLEEWTDRLLIVKGVD